MKLRGRDARHPGATLHAHTPMPKAPKRQRHEKPSKGDNRGAFRRAAGGFLDLNVTFVVALVSLFDGKQGELLAAHYAYPWLNGYRYWHGPDGKGRRRLVPMRRRHWSYGRWSDAGLKLQRRNGEHTLRLSEALALCVEVGACPIKETKSRAFAKYDRPWRLLDAMCVHYDVPNWCKALTTMFGIAGKTVRAARAGVPLAWIYGKGLRGRLRRVARTRVLARRSHVTPYATW